MKAGFFSLFLCLAVIVYGQTGNTWDRRADFSGLKRTRAVGIAIGDYGYAGTGVDTAEMVRNDWWRYDPGTDSWSQMADVPGSKRRNAVAFVINDKGYVGTGIDTSVSDFGSKQFDFYEYAPLLNSWTAKANFPGGGGFGVYQATGFSVDTLGFIACGKIGHDSYTAEMWEYSPTMDTWTARPPFPGGDRHQLSSFGLEGHGYVGMGTDHDIYRKDWWKYDPATFSWSAAADLPGTERACSQTFVIQSRAYVVFGSDGGFLDELWEYNPFSDSWNVKNSFDGSARKYGIAFAIADSGYAGLGQGASGKKMSFYRYAPSGPLSVEEITASDLRVFPNPVTEKSIISLPHVLQQGHLAIYDISGRVYFYKSFDQNNISLAAFSAPAGQYILSVQDQYYNYLGSTKISIE